MSSSRSDWPAVPDFHPEFGLLCSSPRRRRGMRFAMVAMVATMVIGATMGLAVAHWPDGEALASTVQPMDEQPLPAGLDASPVARAQDACKAGVAQDLAAFFFNSTCGSSKLHARHGARAANRVATVILGRVAAAPVATDATEQSPQDANVRGGIAEKSTNSMPALAHSTLPSKKSKAASSAPMALTPPERALQSGFDAPFGRFR